MTPGNAEPQLGLSEVRQSPGAPGPRPGYKQTEVGVIPEDWEIKQVEEISIVTSGKRLPLGEKLTDSVTPHPYIRVTDMRPGTVETADIKYVPQEVYPSIKRYRIFRDDIFISVAGTLGIVGKIPDSLDGANLTENADRLTAISCSRDFLLYVLMSPLIQDTIQAIQTVGAQPKLALTRIRKFSIPHPPLPEQRAIAEALSDVDGLLGGLDRLIAKKRDLKQAAMQQLLTAQTRLPGFHGEWETKPLGEIAIIRKGELITGATVRPGSVPVVAGGREPAYYHDTPNRGPRCITISASGASAGYIALYNIPIFASDCSTIEETDAYSLDFLYNCLLLRQGAIYKMQTGGAQPHVQPSDLNPLAISIPPTKTEQTAIAEVLSEMDAELAALERRREKTRALKQAMMQQLLTGQTRLE